MINGIFYVEKALNCDSKTDGGKGHVQNDSSRYYHVFWMLMAALCIVLRPASCVFWTSCAILVLLRLEKSKRWRTVALGVSVGAVTFAVSACVDRWMYGRYVANMCLKMGWD